MWFAGGGIRRGSSLGETDEFSYNVVSDPVPIHDIQATFSTASASITRG